MRTPRTIRGLRLLTYRALRLPQVLEVWNAAAGRQFPLSAELFLQNGVRDPHIRPEACWLATVPACPSAVGVCVAKVVREPLGADGWLPERGWISLLAVHPDYQRRGVGTALLARAERYLRRQGRAVIALGTDPNHFFPGVPVEEGALAFFRGAGYALVGDAYDLYRAVGSVSALRGGTVAEERGVEIRPLKTGDASRLLAFLDSVFPGRWRYTVGRYLAHGGAIGDIMGVLNGPWVVGFAHMFHPGSGWIGPSIAWTHGASRRAGGIGPMGLAPEIRGRGLGLALLDRCVGHLAGIGVEEIVVDWTVLLDFYGRAGFSIWRHYRHGEKQFRAGGRAARGVDPTNPPARGDLPP